MTERLRLADILGGLSIVADLGYGLPSEEAMRSCLIGTGVARAMGLPEPEVAVTFYTALLFHIGCSTFSHEPSTTTRWRPTASALGRTSPIRETSSPRSSPSRRGA
jgi:hypothetical protein